VRPFWVAAVVFGLFAEWAAEAAPITVPIYIEDSHAGSFYWLAEHLDLDEEYTLIHFDAHTDASAIFDSDKLRERLRRVGSLEERQNLLEQWRSAGAIQCFNWIEPLMPAPISQVLWVHRGRRGGEEREARAQLDGHLEAASRTAGSFRERYRVVQFDQLRAQLKKSRPVVITIDLDYFAGVPANRRAREFERVWRFVAECRNLRAVTLAISRPYLKSDEQADDLVRLAIEASLSLPTASIQFEPFAVVGKDRSLRAREFLKRKEEVPAFKLAHASGKLRALLLANRDRITVRTQPEAWNEQLATWENGHAAVRLVLRNHEPSTDNIWRVPIAEEIEVELQTDGALRQTEWFALVPEYRRCNLTADSSEKSAFAIGAPPRPRWREVRLPGTGRVLSIPREPGVTLVKARVLIDGHLRETAPIEIRRIKGTGFRAALLEQFGLPYLFGSGQLRAGGETGPETGFGADCANFVIYALRRQGYAVPWSNPKQLKKYLEPVAPDVRPGESILNESDIANGLIVHLGSHVAAVMEDRPPLGILDANDRVAHQLEGVPEILSLGRLLASRKTDRFDLWRVPKSGERIDLVMGGDVMLGRTIGSAIEQGFDPLLGLRPLLEPAAARIVNLECVLSDKGAAVPGKRYCFRAPFDALRVLTSARIDAVSLANNHAADFGRNGLLDAIARLESGGVITIGAGETAPAAPYFFTAHNGRKGAVIALSDVDDDDSSLVATTGDRERMAAALAEARAGASFVLVFMHWGDENVVGVTERQRELARWLIDHGADAIAGSHPHCLQPFDSYRGRPIFYSLGNLVFDGAPTLPSWNRGQLLTFDLSGARPLFRLVPVQLDARGFPRIVESETRERRKDHGELQIAGP
jgi:Bacterial capsule synthesis protein PGA_cap